MGLIGFIFRAALRLRPVKTERAINWPAVID